MIKTTNYHSDWQNNRINYIMSMYDADFFSGKSILELGSYNGYIGAYFQNIGANVTCVDGRKANCKNIKKNYPNISKIIEQNLDTTDWSFGKYDVIINFGLYYHLSNYHTEHLINCIDNCNLMFFESVIYDSPKQELFFRDEFGDDQSLSNLGGTPTTSFIENIFKSKKVNFEIHYSSKLNDGYHYYDWKVTNKNIYNQFQRRFWVIK